MKKTIQWAVVMGFAICSHVHIRAQAPNNDAAQDSLALLKALNGEEEGVGHFPKKAFQVLKQFNINGYYRFVTNYRHLEQSYAHLANMPNNIFVGDDSQIPQLSLNISGSVTKNTSFGTDLFMWTPMTGQGQPENVKGLNLGVSLYGTYSNTMGDFTVRAGGINWYALSPFTFQTNKGYNRFSIFERNPWDPNTKSMDERYRTFYNDGGINQDQRWGQQAFQGLILEGKNLPKGFSGTFMYGKSQLNGGLSPLPNNSVGGMIKKEYGNNFVSINTFNQISYTDSTQRRTVGFNLASVEFRNKIGKFLLSGEVGVGRAFDQDTSKGWGEAVSVKISTTVAKKFPVEMHIYRISPRVLNNNGAFLNTAVIQGYNASSNVPNQAILPAVASAVVPIGQLANNRQGIDLNAQINLGPFKTSFGYSNSTEIENISSRLTYTHVINGLALSHFWRWDFPSNVGPYNNLSKVYRSVYETVNLTEVNSTTGLPLQQKYFNTIEVNTKFKTQIFKRDLHVFYMGQFSSVQNFAAPITVLNEGALLRTYYHQLETYYSLTPGLVWSTYFGYERILANYSTNVDAVTRRPKNQTGISIATGFDIKLSKGAGLYLRQRWMDYKDTSFRNDRYSGFETTAEIKIFF